MSFQYRRIPITIEAFQWTEEVVKAVADESTTMLPGFFIEAVGSGVIIPSSLNPNQMMIKTKEGTTALPLNNWVIRGPEGEIHSCDPQIFAKTYEKIYSKADVGSVTEHLVNNPSINS